MFANSIRRPKFDALKNEVANLRVRKLHRFAYFALIQILCDFFLFSKLVAFASACAVNVVEFVRLATKVPSRN